MLIRFVRMTFKEEEVENFLLIFESSKHNIKNFPGCNHLELFQDYHNPAIFSTYSTWENDEYLDNYRNSELFKKVWKKTKVLFAESPVAYSQKKHTLVD
ncbi:MAG: antibiotic biosynthesis monooxygenase [Cyclobacteriaceae bacterium]|nr:antibiotic biosynthesis monooxygenase [Cyclobacteriaceae bacterium]